MAKELSHEYPLVEHEHEPGPRLSSTTAKAAAAASPCSAPPCTACPAAVPSSHARSTTASPTSPASTFLMFKWKARQWRQKSPTSYIFQDFSSSDKRQSS